MADIQVLNDGSIQIPGGAIYTPYEVRLPDNTVIAHESRGGSLVSAAAAWSGDFYLEVSHLGHGPAGGELVMVATAPDRTQYVALGALVQDTVPQDVPASWPVALDLALGLVVDTTVDSGPKDDIEDFFQKLLGVVHG